MVDPVTVRWTPGDPLSPHELHALQDEWDAQAAADAERYREEMALLGLTSTCAGRLAFAMTVLLAVALWLVIGIALVRLSHFGA